MNWRDLFQKGVRYDQFLERYGTAAERQRWREVGRQVSLSAEQIRRLQMFRRQMHVLCLAGVWCGDCAEQCPILAAFASHCPQIDLRFLDRDEHPELSEYVSICGGKRVPVVIFLSEDDFLTGWYGDRTLAKYRQLAAQCDGAACPTGLVTDHELLAAVTDDWLDEFERHQWILRTSPRLRSKHGD
ncbi:MAG: hypothetical protein KatS3mg110_4193 [Pirellulaceae bacterium]|nr:MAG: hypothetical protein KatS3mg110_4193 [Pirellulaceae bacterium]